MDIITLIKQRKSIRHFTKDVPSKEMLLTCLEAAGWAPNPTSQQPWKFIVLTGNKLKKVTPSCVSRVSSFTIDKTAIKTKITESKFILFRLKITG